MNEPFDMHSVIIQFVYTLDELFDFDQQSPWQTIVMKNKMIIIYMGQKDHSDDDCMNELLD